MTGEKSAIAKKVTEAEVEAMPPLCVAGCAWFQQATKHPEGYGVCYHEPLPVSKRPGGFCSKFETLDDYRARMKTVARAKI